jgi:iron complex transport system substrate-binding protein
MFHRYIQLFAGLSLLFFLSCGTDTTPVGSKQPSTALTAVELSYAKAFTILRNDSETHLTIINPNDGQVVQEIVISENRPNNSQKIWVKKHPSKVLSSSVTHLAYLDALKHLDALKGFSQTNYIYNSTVRTAVENGTVSELNAEGNINLEKVVSIEPDVFFISGLLGKLPQFQKIYEANIPVIEVIEWVEVNPLARAEWIKFFACFYDEHALADSLFAEIEQGYLSTKALTNAIEKKSLVMSGKSYKGTWYMPGGKNYWSILMDDAGGLYPYFNNEATNSLPLDLEKVATDFLHADCWISPGASSLAELLNEDARYKKFKPMQTGNVFEPNKRVHGNGSNDFWETGLLRPDMLIKDLVKIFHPNLLPHYELYFYKQLE